MSGLWGALLLVAAGTAAGFGAARELGARRRFLGAMADAAAWMQEEISALATPVAVLLERLSGEGEAAPFFADVAALMQQGCASAWQDATARAAARFFLGGQDVAAVLALGDGLGRYGREEELARMGLAQSRLAARAEAAEQLCRRYGRLLRFAGFAAGACAALLIS